jgi:hypothetical protein
MNARLDFQQQEAEDARIEITLRALDSAWAHGTPEIHLNWLAAECGVSKWWKHNERKGKPEWRILVK